MPGQRARRRRRAVMRHNRRRQRLRRWHRCGGRGVGGRSALARGHRQRPRGQHRLRACRQRRDGPRPRGIRRLAQSRHRGRPGLAHPARRGAALAVLTPPGRAGRHRRAHAALCRRPSAVDRAVLPDRQRGAVRPPFRLDQALPGQPLVAALPRRARPRRRHRALPRRLGVWGRDGPPAGRAGPVRLFWEDADWCRRLAGAGYSVWCVPDATVRHDEGGTRRHTGSALATRSFHAGAYRYWRTHHAPQPWNPLRWAAAAALGSRALLLLAAHRVERLAAPRNPLTEGTRP